MGYYCTVPQCTSLAGKTKNVKFHRFPRDKTMADKWNLILKRGKPYTQYSKVCSLHFTQADYNVTTMGKNKGQWKTLSKDAVPSQNLPKLHPDGTVMVIRKSRTVKYREPKKQEDSVEKDKWVLATAQHTPLPLATSQETQASGPDSHDANLNFRLQTLSAIASSNPHHPPIPHTPHTPHTPLTPHPHQALTVHSLKPKKQDAIMQTDPVQGEDDDAPAAEPDPPGYPYPKSSDDYDKKYDVPKDYTKSEDDYIPQTNEEYNSEAEKYALERKALNGYDKQVDSYPKSVPMENYQKLDMYSNFGDKAYQNRQDNWYASAYDAAESLRSQQHALQLLQEPREQACCEGRIKQEVDAPADDDNIYYDRPKDQLVDSSPLYDGQRRLHPQRLMEHLSHQVKQEPDAAGCENVMQPQGSPYFSNGHNAAGGYYGEAARPGAELLIAKQNALASHPQLWQNTMKRPFFYSESTHYNAPPLLHRYEDLSRILQ